MQVSVNGDVFHGAIWLKFATIGHFESIIKMRRDSRVSSKFMGKGTKMAEMRLAARPHVASTPSEAHKAKSEPAGGSHPELQAIGLALGVGALGGLATGLLTHNAGRGVKAGITLAAVSGALLLLSGCGGGDNGYSGYKGIFY